MLICLVGKSADVSFVTEFEKKASELGLVLEPDLNKAELKIFVMTTESVRPTFAAQTIAARIYRSELRKLYPEITWTKKFSNVLTKDISSSRSAILAVPRQMSAEEKSKLASALALAINNVLCS